VILFLQKFFDGDSATSRVVLVRFVFLLLDGFGLEFSDPFLGSSSFVDGVRHGGNKWQILMWLMTDFRLCVQRSTTLSCYSCLFKIQGCFLHSGIDFMLPLAVTLSDRDDEIQECL
jgi:hypothetical protein